MSSRIKKSFPYLTRYAEKKARRKFPVKPTLRLRKHGRVGMCEVYSDGFRRINVSRKLARTNPLFARAVVVHELAEGLGVGHRKAAQLAGQYLKDHGTTYRREIKRYRRTR